MKILIDRRFIPCRRTEDLNTYDCSPAQKIIPRISLYPHGDLYRPISFTAPYIFAKNLLPPRVICSGLMSDAKIWNQLGCFSLKLYLKWGTLIIITALSFGCVSEVLNTFPCFCRTYQYNVQVDGFTWVYRLYVTKRGCAAGTSRKLCVCI